MLAPQTGADLTEKGRGGSKRAGRETDSLASTLSLPCCSCVTLAHQEAKAAFAEPHHSSLGIWAGPWLASVPLSSQGSPRAVVAPPCHCPFNEVNRRRPPGACAPSPLLLHTSKENFSGWRLQLLEMPQTSALPPPRDLERNAGKEGRPLCAGRGALSVTPRPSAG